MAKRGLPAAFSLDLPEDMPVAIGDFLDEAPPQIPKPRKMQPVPRTELPVYQSERRFPQEIAPSPEPPLTTMRVVPKAAEAPKAPSVIRYQMNLTPNAKKMLDDIVEHVRIYSPEPNARVNEVFQGIVGLLYSAMGELDLAELPRRGAWGSVTAKNFPTALNEAFETAILKSARKRG